MHVTPMFESVDYSVKETAQEVRKALRGQFPGVRFRVNMSRGAAHGWLGVSWTDGPREAQVRAVVGRFQSESSDQSVDCLRSFVPTLYAREDGSFYERRYSCCGISLARDYSDAAEEWATEHAVAGSRWWREDDAPFGPDYFARRALLSGSDLTRGLPADPDEVYREMWRV